MDITVKFENVNDNDSIDQIPYQEFVASSKTREFYDDVLSYLRNMDKYSSWTSKLKEDDCKNDDGKASFESIVSAVVDMIREDIINISNEIGVPNDL